MTLQHTVSQCETLLRIFVNMGLEPLMVFTCIRLMLSFVL